jgi:uncharacterized membrane protein
MKKLLLVFLIIFSFLIGGSILASESITLFSVDAVVNEDSTVDVTESIIYNFGQNNRHGIYRDIPIKYKREFGNYKFRLNNISVVDEYGVSYPFDAFNSGDNKRIKIGDPDKYVTGEKKYVINYTVERAINYFDDHDEFYWNVTGNEWEVPILQAKANIIMPTKTGVEMDCFSGGFGSQAKCSNQLYDERNNIFGFTQGNLGAGEGLTVVLSVPKGVIYEPSKWDNFLYFLKDNYIAGLPVIVFILLLYLWYKKGKDPEGRGTIVAQFDTPDNLTPLEVGIVIDEKLHKKDVSAEIINLAVKGYLKITKIEKGAFIFSSTDYILEKLKDDDGSLSQHEKELLDAIFDKDVVDQSVKEIIKKIDEEGQGGVVLKLVKKVLTSQYGEALEAVKDKDDIAKRKNIVKMSKLKNYFYKKWPEITKKSYEAVVDKGYFKKSPRKTRNLYRGIGIFLMFSITALGGVLLNNFIGVASFFLTGLMVFVFSNIMPAKTKKGVLAKEHILGLKRYLNVAEKDRINFHNAPEKNPEIFEKLLPFAMVLGVEKNWAKQFEDIYKDQQPSWYSSSDGAAFSAIALSNSLGSFQSKADSTIMSSAGSGGSGMGGGGFSGGGGGGGGGGSW